MHNGTILKTSFPVINCFQMTEREFSLNSNQRRFVAEYMSVMPRNATAAYLRAFPHVTRESAQALSSRLLTDHPGVRAAVAEWERQLNREFKLTAQEIVKDLTLVATADPRELCEHYTGSCRHCHGIDFKAQRTPEEYRQDLTRHIKNREAQKLPDPLGLEFDIQGGIGFNKKKPPHPDCPECQGEGVGYQVFKDTRDLSPGAARLYQGVKTTREGIEIKIRSQDKAIELAGQTLGLFKTGLELGNMDGQPFRTSAAQFSDDELAGYIAAAAAARAEKKSE